MKYLGEGMAYLQLCLLTFLKELTESNDDSKQRNIGEE